MLECLVNAVAADVSWEFAETKHQEPTFSSVVKQELRGNNKVGCKIPCSTSNTLTAVMWVGGMAPLLHHLGRTDLVLSSQLKHDECTAIEVSCRDCGHCWTPINCSPCASQPYSFPNSQDSPATGMHQIQTDTRFNFGSKHQRLVHHASLGRPGR